MNEAKTLYFDCSKGLSADLIVGALCSLGVPPSALEWELGQVDLGAYHLHIERRLAGNEEAVRFWFHAGAHHSEDAAEDHDHGHGDHDHDHGHCGHDHDHGHGDHGHGDDDHDHGHCDHGHDEKSCGHDHGATGIERTVGEARAMVESADLSETTKRRASAVLQRLSASADRIAAGEVAALLAACAGIEHLGVARVAFFSRTPGAPTEDALGGAFAAEFVTSSCALPALQRDRTGLGVDEQGRTLAATLGREE